MEKYEEEILILYKWNSLFSFISIVIMYKTITCTNYEIRLHRDYSSERGTETPVHHFVVL